MTAMQRTSPVPSAPGVVARGRGRRRRREGTIIVVLAVIALLLVGASLAVGAYSISLPDLVSTILGHGSAKDSFIVGQLRLPRVAMGVLVGVAFGLAGALFQSLLGNPLASPDIIGITGGASAAAVSAILILGLDGIAVSGFALGGALIVAATISALSWRSGLTGYRFVLIGIGIAFVVQAILGYLLTRADVRDAQGAFVWLVGSLSSSRWNEILLTAASLVVLLPIVAVLAPRLRIAQLGDQAAASLGLGVQRSRIAVIAVAVTLAAVGTAAAGPIAFVAFVSAPIARRLVRTGGLALVPSALVGVVIVLAADFAAGHALPGAVQVPVGVITGVIGAPYLLWLLATTNRSREAS